MGERRRAEGPRHRATHGGLRRQDARAHRQPRHPRALARRVTAMMIADAQIHLWSKGETMPPHQAEPYSMADALKDMDAAGVRRALIHPPSWDPDSHAQAEEAAVTYPDRFAILGQFPLDQKESRSLVAGWKKRPGML